VIGENGMGSISIRHTQVRKQKQNIPIQHTNINGLKPKGGCKKRD